MESIFNKRFLDNTEITMNGEVYKNTEAFERKNDEVCYISEYGLQELAEQDHELTDKEIVEKGIGESYNSILEQAKEYWNEFVEMEHENGATDEEIGTVEDLAEYAFQEVDWQYVCTWFSELTY